MGINMNDNEQTPIELLPCPFCGGEVLYLMDMTSMFYVYCDQCFASGPDDGTISGAREAWNRGSENQRGKRTRPAVKTDDLLYGDQNE
jgi:Lar family restriction alleviation protein